MTQLLNSAQKSSNWNISWPTDHCYHSNFIIEAFFADGQYSNLLCFTKSKKEKEEINKPDIRLCWVHY